MKIKKRIIKTKKNDINLKKEIDFDLKKNLNIYNNKYSLNNKINIDNLNIIPVKKIEDDDSFSIQNDKKKLYLIEFEKEIFKKINTLNEELKNVEKQIIDFENDINI